MTWREDQALTVDDRRARVPASASPCHGFGKRRAPWAAAPWKVQFLMSARSPSGSEMRKRR